MPDIVRLQEVNDVLVADVNALFKELSPNAEMRSLESMRAALNDMRLEVWVAKESGRIVGMASLIEVPMLGKMTGLVEDVVVSESQRGKGIGKVLVQKLLDRARERKMKYVELTSRPSRIAAAKLYTGLGFKQRETNVYRMTF